MPRTTFRLRVAPILHVEMMLKPNLNVDEDENENSEKIEKKTVTHTEQGEWAEVTNITTKETQTFDVAQTTKSPAPNLLCAQMMTKGRKKWLTFDKAGTIVATYGYSFGEHLWILKIQYLESQNSNITPSSMDQSGSMVVGVVNKRFSNQKMFGSLINYSLFKGEVIVKVYLDSNKKKLIVYSPQHPQGDVHSELPKDGLFYPAIQNKTAVTKLAPRS